MEGNLLEYTQRLLKSYGLKPSNKLSQYFIVDVHAIRRIVELADPARDDVVLEIGCGTGNLTRFIAEKAGKVIGVEIDKRLLNVLRNELSCYENVELLNKDALQLEFPSNCIIVSNVPYHISSRLVLKTVEAEFKKAVLTFQHDFAKRLYGKPGTKEYGRLTLNVGLKSLVQPCEILGKKAFYPPASVNSQIILLTPRKPMLNKEEERVFKKVIEVAFKHRNKLLKNSFSLHIKEISRVTGMSKGEILGRLASENLLDKRPFELDLNQYVDLTKKLVNL